MISGRILAAFAIVLAFAHPASAACDLEAVMAQLSTKVPDGQVKDENWFNLYSQQFKEVMMAAQSGDQDTACQKAQDLVEWVDRNPPGQ